MSQNEIKSKRSKSVILATLLALIPSIFPSLSHASIPQCYYPAYGHQIWNGTGNISVAETRVPASINRAAIMVSTPSKIFYGEDGTSISPELIANFNHIKSSDKPFDFSAMIPLDMQPSSDSGMVMAMVADRSMTSFLNSESVRSSYVGQAATTVEQKMKQEVVFGGESEASTQHKLNFNLQAFQALAQIQYTGYTNAAIKYKIAAAQVDVELYEKFSGNRDLVLSHSITRDNRVSGLSMRWNF